MQTEKLYAVDRIENERAVLVGDAGDTHEIPLAQLPGELREGVVLRVPMGEGGDPDWPAARVDEAETGRRLKEAERLLRELRRRDPGGDIEL